jgi:excinuclease ABC subunit C
LIQRLRDEAHRFAITFHRLKRSKKSIASELDAIEGLGESTRTKLLKHFKSVAKIKSADQAELETVVGTHRAKLVYEYFKDAPITSPPSPSPEERGGAH